MLFEFGYQVVYGCGRGSAHRTCLVLLIADSEGRKEGEGKEREYGAHVLEAPSMELAEAICSHIGVYMCTCVYACVHACVSLCAQCRVCVCVCVCVHLRTKFHTCTSFLIPHSTSVLY